MTQNYKRTTFACFAGYIVQAVVNNFVPLLFVTFQSSYGISLSKITALISVNFAVQLIVDMLSAGFVDKIGYRTSILAAHFFSCAGLILLTVLPEVMNDAFSGILISVFLYAIGGGLIEVLISPIMEACPTENKEKAMSLLHSFYCWGHAGVVLTSTAFFAAFGIGNWKILCLIWALIPLLNAVLFAVSPINTLTSEDAPGLTFKELFALKAFWILMLMMTCAGASEQAVSQWASVFAEKGLGITKTAGDLAGPMCFALLMGLSRLIYGKYGEKLNLDAFMKYSTVLCMVSYLCISLIPNPVIGLIGCAATGFSVGILWPGTFSKAAVAIKRGGTAMFALLALAGDLGCFSGPSLAGYISDAFGGNLRIGILFAIVFPFMMLCCLVFGKKLLKKARTGNET